MQKTVTSLFIVGVVLAGGWFLYSHPVTSKAPSAPVARVNGEDISRQDFDATESQLATEQSLDLKTIDDATRDNLKKQALEVLISRTLIRQAVAKAGVSVNPDDINTRVTALSSQYENEQAFTDALAAAGVNLDTLKIQLGNDIAIETYLFNTLQLDKVTASDAEVQAVYNEQAKTTENAPALKDVRDQIAQFVVGQKQQALILKHIEDLKSKAQIEILI